jgi:hypothetical protein
MSMEMRPIRRTTPTPLGNAFFSEFNREAINKAIRDKVHQRTGQYIDNQNQMDLETLMRTVWTDMAKDPYRDVRTQVAEFNAEVVHRASGTIVTGLLQQLLYLRDISENPIPIDIPISTSTAGNKLPSNFKFGINK